MSQADAIKILAVVTATPRWVGALLAAEGLSVPRSWLPWWTVASVLFAAAMAGVEGWSFAYVFAAWRRAQGRTATRLIILAVASAAVFVVVGAPYVAAQVRGVTVGDVLSADAALYIWAACVFASTIMIVASVGYAQKTPTVTQAKRIVTEQPSEQETNKTDKTYKCAVCGASFAKQQGLAAHSKRHKRL